MPISNAKFAMINIVNAFTTSPGRGVNKAVVATTQSKVVPIKKVFLKFARSAKAPIIGEKKATIKDEIVIALDHNTVPSIALSAMDFVKYVA